MGTAKQLFNFASNSLKKVKNVQERVERAKVVVIESLELAEKSDKPGTRISRMQVAIKQLDYMRKEFPSWPDAEIWEKQLKELTNGFPHFFVSNISDIIRNNTATIENMKTQGARYNRSQKLVEKLRGFCGQCAEADNWLLLQIKLLEENFPPAGMEPQKGITVPTEFEWDAKLAMQISSMGVAQGSQPKVTKNKVSIFGIVGIWFGWLICLAPFGQLGELYGLAALCGSFIMPYYTVKWLNARRKNKSPQKE